MALELSTPILVVAVLSWLLSAYLLVRLWRGSDHIGIKLGLTLLLAVPVVGPFLYLWIQNFPATNAPDLMDQLGFSSDFLARWRSRLEQRGKLPPLVQYWRKRRRK